MTIKPYPLIPYERLEYTEEERLERVESYFQFMDIRRSVRDYSDEKIPKSLISKIIMTASTAPSGAHKQPWTFCAISNPDLKSNIRKAAEAEEYINYNGRMSKEWLEDLAPLQTNWEKEFIDIAPWIIVVFKKVYELSNNKKKKNYYVNESVGIAVGFLLAAIQQAGLVALTHTPSPMNFLEKILDRPKNERAFLLIPVGIAAESAKIPDLARKSGDEVIAYYE